MILSYRKVCSFKHYSYFFYFVIFEFIGSVIAGFSVRSNSANAAQNLKSGVTSITGSDTNFINQLQVSSVNVNGRSSSAPSSASSNDSNGSDEGTNVGLIAGLTVGLVAAATLISVISVVSYQQYHKQKGQHLLQPTDEEYSYPNEGTTNPSSSAEFVSQMPQHTSATSPTVINNGSHAPLSNNTTGQRAPSGALSVTKLDGITVDTPMPDVELIKLD